MKQNYSGLPESIRSTRGFGERLQLQNKTWGMWWYEHKYWLGVFAVVVLAVLFFVRTLWLKETNQLPIAPVRTEVGSEQLPANVPTDLPYVYADQVVVHNFEVASGEDTQGVRKWLVDAKPFDVYSVYKNYLQSNSWQISLDVAEQAQYLLAGRKADVTLSVSIQTDTASGKTLLEVGGR